MPVTEPYTACTITIPANTPKQLLPLIRAIAPAASSHCREFVVQNDPDDSTTTAFIGDSSVSATRRGAKIVVGASETFRGIHNEDVNVARYWAFSTADLTLNVQLIRG